MKFAVLRLAFCGLGLALAGCSTLSDLGIESKKIDYKTAAANRSPVRRRRFVINLF